MTQQTEMEFAGVKFKGGKLFIAITALSTLIGGLYGSFEVYKDYMDMKAQIQSYVAPDLSGIEKKVEVMSTKVEEAVEYSRDIKNGLRDDILSIEKQVDRTEDMVRESEEKVRDMIEIAEGRFENKRNQLQQDYDQKADNLRNQTGMALGELEKRLNGRLQRALDNPLAN